MLALKILLPCYLICLLNLASNREWEGERLENQKKEEQEMSEKTGATWSIDDNYS